MQVRKMACMQIGETVQRLMAEKGLSLEGVAELVRAQGPEARNVKYQHIQQLIEHPNRRPRFLPELAWAFGMSVEEFLGRRNRSVHEPHAEYMSPSVRQGPETMEDAIKLLKYIAAARGLPEESIFDPVLLYVAHEVVSHAEERVGESNLLDFMQRFNAHMKRQDRADGTEQRKAAGAGGNDERAPRRSRGSA